TSLQGTFYASLRGLLVDERWIRSVRSARLLLLRAASPPMGQARRSVGEALGCQGVSARLAVPGGRTPSQPSRRMVGGLAGVDLLPAGAEGCWGFVATAGSRHSLIRH